MTQLSIEEARKQLELSFTAGKEAEASKLKLRFFLATSPVILPLGVLGLIGLALTLPSLLFALILDRVYDAIEASVGIEEE